MLGPPLPTSLWRFSLRTWASAPQGGPGSLQPPGAQTQSESRCTSYQRGPRRCPKCPPTHPPTSVNKPQIMIYFREKESVRELSPGGKQAVCHTNRRFRASGRAPVHGSQRKIHLLKCATRSPAEEKDEEAPGFSGVPTFSR